MRILLLNPNTSPDVTELMLTAGRRAASPGTELIGATAPRGVPYIANEAEALIGGAVAIEIIAEHAPRVDAVIIAAFGDPGLAGARELFALPIVGLAEAAMLTACMLGRRFAIVTFARALLPWYRDCVQAHGLSMRCAGIRALEGRFGPLAAIGHEKEDLLVELAQRTIEEDGADVLIFAGAPLSGLAVRVADRISAPVVESSRRCGAAGRNACCTPSCRAPPPAGEGDEGASAQPGLTDRGHGRSRRGRTDGRVVAEIRAPASRFTARQTRELW